MASKSKNTKSILFVCLGNICRSPMAEAVFLDLIEKKEEKGQWKLDSAAIGTWHIGHGPDSRAMKTLKKNGITKYKHAARQVTEQDFKDFDYVVGMDHDNISYLEKLKQKDGASLELFGEYDTAKTGPTVHDPYYDDDISAFDEVYEKIVRCCDGFYKHIKENS